MVTADIVIGLSELVKEFENTPPQWAVVSTSPRQVRKRPLAPSVQEAVLRRRHVVLARALSTVLGKCGTFGEFEKCSGSMASPSPCR